MIMRTPEKQAIFDSQKDRDASFLQFLIDNKFIKVFDKPKVDTIAVYYLNNKIIWSATILEIDPIMVEVLDEEKSTLRNPVVYSKPLNWINYDKVIFVERPNEEIIEKYYLAFMEFEMR